VNPAIGTDEIRAMLATAEEKLRSARHLSAGGFHSDAASRAYYAVFHIVTAMLATRGLSFASHAQLLGAFNREFLRPGLLAGVVFRDIQRLFDERQKGDYGTMLAVDAASAHQDLAIADRVLNACKAHLQANLPRE
jgi:uncharacterized protein (UPF0332 family)